MGRRQDRARLRPGKAKMTRILFALSLNFGGLIYATQTAFAAGPSQCAPRAAVVAQLAERYGETPRGIGMAGDSAVIEIFVSDSASWTITATLTNGLSCLLASGQGWETLEANLPARGDPA